MHFRMDGFRFPPQPHTIITFPLCLVWMLGGKTTAQRSLLLRLNLWNAAVAGEKPPLSPGEGDTSQSVAHLGGTPRTERGVKLR